MTGQAQDDDSEEELDGANGEGDDFQHAWGGYCTMRKWQLVGGLDVLVSLKNCGQDWP